MTESQSGPRGFKEETIVAKTGKSSAEWYALLDASETAPQGHTAMARYLRAEQGVDPWWAQRSPCATSGSVGCATARPRRAWIGACQPRVTDDH